MISNHFTDLLIKKALKPKQEEREIIPFVPNPGSQSKLFFDLLGVEKGEEREIIRANGDRLVLPSVDPSGWRYSGGKNSIAFLGGFGSGKSYCGAAFCYLLSCAYPGTKGLIVANDYDQLKRATVYKLIEFCEHHNIGYEPKYDTIERSSEVIARYKKSVIINGMHFDVVTAQSFEDQTARSKVSGMGSEYCGAWDDEGFFGDESIPKSILTRLRKPGTAKLLFVSSTLNWNNVYNWAWDWFADPERGNEKIAKFAMVKAISSSENIYLDDDYEGMLAATRDSDLFSIQVASEFVDVTTGRIARFFDRSRHVSPVKYNPKLQIAATFDFNVNPATCTIIQYKMGERVEALAEVWLEDSDTFKSAEDGAKLILEITGKKNIRVDLFGDATGNNRSANSQSSNWQIVNNIFRKFDLIPHKRVGHSNPPVVDRCNSCNNALEKDWVVIDPKCKYLIKDMASVRWNDKGNDIDKKTDLKLTHAFDNFTYAVHSVIPYGGVSRGATMGTAIRGTSVNYRDALNLR